MKRLAVLASAAGLAAVSLLASPAAAHETGACQGHAYGNHMLDIWLVGSDDATVVSVADVVYIDDRNTLNGNGLWIYLESNGVGGLQRGGVAWHGNTDPCQESTNPDTILY